MQLDYLVTLQRHHEAVALDPSEWLPWNYEATLAELGVRAVDGAQGLEGVLDGYGRMIRLEDELRIVIERRLEARRLDCEFIFHRTGNPVGEFRKTWKTACEAAGLAVTVDRDGKEFVRALRLPYDLRRTAVRNMVRGGTDPAIAMKISGHRTRAIPDRYNIISGDDLRTAVRNTTAYVASLPPSRRLYRSVLRAAAVRTRTKGRRG